jgi:hypothetical protein
VLACPSPISPRASYFIGQLVSRRHFRLPIVDSPGETGAGVQRSLPNCTLNDPTEPVEGAVPQLQALPAEILL